MEFLFAITIGVLVASAVYLMLSNHLLRFIFGLVLISNAANLTIFVSGRLTDGAPPLIPEGADAPLVNVANALSKCTDEGCNDRVNSKISSLFFEGSMRPTSPKKNVSMKEEIIE